jgi:hypothetical protein
MIPIKTNWIERLLVRSVIMDEREYILYHKKRLAAQAAGEPFARAIIYIYNHEAPILRIYPDGHLECIYPSQAEIDRIHGLWAEAVTRAIYLVEHGFDSYGILGHAKSIAKREEWESRDSTI